MNAAFRSLILLLPLWCVWMFIRNRRVGHRPLLWITGAYLAVQVLVQSTVAINLYRHESVIMAFVSGLSSLMTVAFSLAVFSERKDLEHTLVDSEALQVLRNHDLIDMEQRSINTLYLAQLSRDKTSELVASDDARGVQAS